MTDLTAAASPDPRGTVPRLSRALGTGPRGLSTREVDQLFRFDARLRLMSSVTEHAVNVKGAPEAVPARTLTADAPTDRADAERDLRLLGLVGLYDPPRSEVADAVRRWFLRRRTWETTRM